MHLRYSLRITFLTTCLFSTLSVADDWNRFRGPNGTGVCLDEQATPITWSETENLKWKLELPGPGSSSPIVVADNVFVTCWTGYGIEEKRPGNQDELHRHLICVDRQTGKTRWTAIVKARLPEDEFDGRFSENGFATHTPVSDGKSVYAFFGKTGVFAYDMQGKKLWQKDVGEKLHPRHWGSAASPIIYEDKLIVPAFIESNTLWALNKTNGEVVWKEQADGFGDTWSTPVIAKNEDSNELVVAVPYEIWAFDPDIGDFKWYCQSVDSNSMCASVIAKDGIVYGVGGRNSGSVAVKSGGKGNVTGTNVVWRERHRARITTPLVHDGLMYWVNNSIANCIETKNGKKIYQHRIPQHQSPGNLDDDKKRRDDDHERRNRRTGRRSLSTDYASLVAASGKIYHTSRNGTIYVFKTGKNFEIIARNRFASDDGDFSATPAISNGEIFIRSSKFLYCVSAQKGE